MVDVEGDDLYVRFVTYAGHLMFRLKFSFDPRRYPDAGLEYEYLHDIGTNMGAKIAAAISALSGQSFLLKSAVSFCDQLLENEKARRAAERHSVISTENK